VQLEEQLDSGTLERLEKQSRLLQRIYQADFAESPTSRAAGSSRSNMIALRGVTPHVAQNLERRGGSAIDGRTTRHAGYALSQRKRKRIEECFGWRKTIALMRKVRHRGPSG
jgi:hypothetical protein